MNEINARRLLFTVADVLDDIGVEFFLYGGTFLGAVRERKFIEIDRDVDLAILQENLSPRAREIGNQLVKAGIEIEVVDHRHRRPWNGSIYAIKFCGYGEHGDLSAFKKIRGKRAIPSHVGDFWLVHTARFLEELGNIEFYGRSFRCPRDADGFLTEKYDDWRTPHTKFYNVSKPTCKKPESWMKEAK